MSSRSVLIVGLGLIGGSLAMALRRSGFAGRILGIDVCGETVSRALQTGIVDEASTGPEGLAPTADIAVVCTPIKAIVPWVRRLSSLMRPGTVITDVGSTKTEILNSLKNTLPDEIGFVGGHPMAGSERQGLLAADPYLFENAVYVLVPQLPESKPRSVEIVTDLIEATGATPVQLAPEKHDRIVAAVSHLPHLVAAAIINTVMEDTNDWRDVLTLAAGGFRDTTRVASGDPLLWYDIFSTNRGMVVRMLEAMEGHLAELRRLVLQGEKGRSLLIKRLGQAKKLRDQLPVRSKGILTPVFELVVQVVDKPGAISEVTACLAEAGVNIIDIEILRVREGEGGVLRLGVESEEGLKTAIRVLEARGITAHRR